MASALRLLASRHADLVKVVFPTAIATGFVWTMASGKPLLDPYRWLSGEETAKEGHGAPAKTLLTLRR